MIIRKDSLIPLDFDGLAIYDYTAEKQTTSSFAVVEIPPRARHRLARSSRSDKYYYVAQGTVHFRLQGTGHELRKGDFCLVKQGQAFSYRNDTIETACLVLVHTPPLDLEAEAFLQEEER